MLTEHIQQEIGPRLTHDTWTHSGSQIDGICYAIFSNITKCEKKEHISQKLRAYFDSLGVHEAGYKPVLERIKPVIKRRVIAGADIPHEGLEDQFEDAYELVELIAKLVYWDMNDTYTNRAKHEDPDIDELIYLAYKALEDEIESHHEDDQLSDQLDHLSVPAFQSDLHQQICKLDSFILQRHVIHGYAVHRAAQLEKTEDNKDYHAMKFANGDQSLDYRKHFCKALEEFVRLIEWDLEEMDTPESGR